LRQNARDHFFDEAFVVVRVNQYAEDDCLHSFAADARLPRSVA
jgi:hypothetical protein